MHTCPDGYTVSYELDFLMEKYRFDVDLDHEGKTNVIIIIEPDIQIP